MCLIFLSINQHPIYKLIVAGNRDEFYNRETAAAHFWDDHPEILAGRDLEAFGTWLGITRSGKISMLTNYRDPSNIKPHAPSRGALVVDYLLNENTPENYLQQIELYGERYNGFNLLVGNQDELWYYSNYKKGIEKLEPGFYGLSNHLLETPWPKVVRGKERLKPRFEQPVIDTEQVFKILSDENIAEDQNLPNTGLSLDKERALSAMFIKTENYGSRCSTVVLIDKADNVLFTERVYDLKTFAHTTQAYQFKIGS